MDEKAEQIHVIAQLLADVMSTALDRVAGRTGGSLDGSVAMSAILAAAITFVTNQIQSDVLKDPQRLEATAKSVVDLFGHALRLSFAQAANKNFEVRCDG